MSKATKQKKSLLDIDISFKKVSLTQKALLAQHLSVMLKAGLTLPEAIEIIQGQSTGRLKKILKGVLLSINSGQSLSASFARYPDVFSRLFINATRAGEVSGSLEENMSNVAEQMEKDRDLRAKIQGAMLYPVVISLVAFCMGLAMAFVVLPKITPLFEGLKTDLPASTRILIWFSKIVQEQGVLLLLCMVIFIVAFVWFIKQKFSQPITHSLLLKIPIIKKLIKESNLARFCRTLGMLIKSGLNIDEALEITKTTLGNYYYQQSISEVSRRVSKGSKITEALVDFKDLYPEIAIQMIKVGEKSGNLEETLFYLASFYEKEVDNSAKSLSIVIEPIMLIVIGVLVAFLALSIITPIYQITGTVQM